MSPELSAPEDRLEPFGERFLAAATVVDSRVYPTATDAPM